MLIRCPECELQVSDKALSCPHCGYPLSENIKPRLKKSSKKHMRLPNGFGQITEIKGRNLRNPFRAMVTVGKTPEGKPISKMLKPKAYFKTYNEAYEALMEYNKNPYDLESDLTLAQLYEKWSESYFKTLNSNSSIRTITSAWSHCKNISNMRVADARARHIKGIIDETESPNIKSRIKSLMNIMLDYAVEYEIVDRNYARTFSLSKEDTKAIEDKRKEHKAFSEEEFETIRKNSGNIICDMVIIQSYMGWRPQELVKITRDSVNIIDWTITGGMKTDAGTDRVVPIHKNIRELVKKYYDQGNNTLFVLNGKSLTYSIYEYNFGKMVSDLGLEPGHRPHDPRKHFVTMCKKYNVDEYAIKRIVGHSISDITESVYTERNIDWLHSEIGKIG